MVVGVAAAVTSEGCHESERAREGAAAWCRGSVPYPAPCGSRDGRCPSLTPPTPKPEGGGAALRLGGVAQLGERLLCKQEVIGSIPFTSTISRNAAYGV